MTFATVYSRAQLGITTPLVTVEAHISNGLPRFSMVGLPETVVKESKDRVRSAILNSRFKFPARRITVNLAPADIPKAGGRFDLPIAISILLATKQLSIDDIENYEFAGELALSGELRPCQGSLSMAIGVRQSKRQLILPIDNCLEASMIKQIELFPAKHLLEVCAHLTGKCQLPHYPNKPVKVNTKQAKADISDIQGQSQAKRALTIAAAGGHSLLMIGPPGSGKTMLASRMPSILPPLSESQALETAMIKTLANQPLHPTTWYQPPFRSPHHTASAVALVGGGTQVKPGEISLAHHGVLFLDELPQFSRHVLESLREPLESGRIHISRAKSQANYPAQFQLLAAMNPCPCGYYGDTTHDCRCTHEQIQRYHARLSGPFLDRIDLFVQAPRVPTQLLTQRMQASLTSTDIRQHVLIAQQQQIQQRKVLNAKLTPQQLQADDYINQPISDWLQEIVQNRLLSARGYYRLLRVARTIADLAQREHIAKSHINEALLYRQPPLPSENLV